MTQPLITIFEHIHQSGIDELCKFADVKFAYGASRKQHIELSRVSDVIIVKSAVQVDKELINQSPSLRIVARAGTGIDNIDMIEADRLNIKVLTVPTGNSISAAEFTILQMLTLCRRMPEVAKLMKNNDFRRHLVEGRELQNMTVGLVGLGNVGILISDRLKAFGCKVVGWDPDSKYKERFKSNGGILLESFEQLLSEIDILSFHARLTPENYHMMGQEQFQKVKDGLILINCARAELIDQDALIYFLNKNVISQASLDVLEPEPPFNLTPKEHNYQNKLLNHPNVLVTPHIGASTKEAQINIALTLCKEIKKELN